MSLLVPLLDDDDAAGEGSDPLELGLLEPELLEVEPLEPELLDLDSFEPDEDLS